MYEWGKLMCVLLNASNENDDEERERERKSYKIKMKKEEKIQNFIVQQAKCDLFERNENEKHLNCTIYLIWYVLFINQVVETLFCNHILRAKSTE